MKLNPILYKIIKLSKSATTRRALTILGIGMQPQHSKCVSFTSSSSESDPLALPLDEPEALSSTVGLV